MWVRIIMGMDRKIASGNLPHPIPFDLFFQIFPSFLLALQAILHILPLVFGQEQKRT
jgi:hypothetical protein